MNKENLFCSFQGAKRPQVTIPRITVGLATCGRAAGGEAVQKEFIEYFSNVGFGADVVSVGCRGLCYAEPLVEVLLPNGTSRMFCKIDASSARSIADCLTQEEPLLAFDSLPERLHLQDNTAEQERRVLSNCGLVDPFSLEEYCMQGGYSALKKAFDHMSPKAIIEEISAARLRGRGGAGYPTGKKWKACTKNNSTERYVIVNGDEGDPGAYMDRALLESDPHRVLEGLILACYAISAHKAYFFIRAEYPLAIATVSQAIEMARQGGFIGKNILGSDFDLEIDVVSGAGAFLCGESTALVNVLENKICRPRKRPPHLAEAGLWGKPTCINNVETLANVPLIINHGATWFCSVGTEKSPGTKIFSVVGSVECSGLIEVPMGTQLGVIINDIAQARESKAVQIGGPSGAILPSSLSDLEISFEGIDDVDGMMGSGGFVVIGETQCVVDTAAYLLAFSAQQSCKCCKTCREGLEGSAEILTRMTRGQGLFEDIEKLVEWSELCRKHALCGLGRDALNPVQSSLRFFADEYKAHIDGRCPSLVCKELIFYEIDTSRCQGERCCLLTCPGNAIKGRFGKPGHIEQRLCQKCGMCIATCPYSAVRKTSPHALQE